MNFKINRMILSSVIVFLAMSCEKNSKHQLETQNDEINKNELIQDFSNIFNPPVDSIFADFYQSTLSKIPIFMRFQRVFYFDCFYRHNRIQHEIGSTWSIPPVCLQTDYEIIAETRIKGNTIIFITHKFDSLGIDFIKIKNWGKPTNRHNPVYDVLSDYNIETFFVIYSQFKDSVIFSDYERYMIKDDDYYKNSPYDCLDFF